MGDFLNRLVAAFKGEPDPKEMRYGCLYCEIHSSTFNANEYIKHQREMHGGYGWPHGLRD